MQKFVSVQLSVCYCNSNSIMIIFLKNIGHLRQGGMFPNENEQKMVAKNIAFIMFCSMPLMYSITCIFGYFVTFLSDVSKATEGAYQGFALTMWLIIYWLIAFRRFSLYNIIDNLQSLVDQSE